MIYGLLVLTLLIPLLALASPAEEPKEFNIPILDSTQQLFGMQANTVANRLDLFFADQRADDELARSRFRIRRTYDLHDRAAMTNQTQIRLNIRLPKLQDRFRFEFKDKKKKADAKSGSDATLAQNQLDKTWQFKADIGFNASIPPKVFTRGRIRKNWTTGDVIHRFVDETGWYSDRDWEHYTTLDSDLSLDDDTLIRWHNQVDWRLTRKRFRTSHGPSILKRIGDNDAISYGVSVSTLKDDAFFLDNYRVAATYRRNLYKQWIYMDATPGFDFPKMWHFRRTPFIIVAVEALFGGI